MLEMNWTWCDATTAIATLIGVGGGGFGAWWTYRQWRHEQKLKRAESLKALLDDFENNTIRAVVCSSDADDAAKTLFIRAESDEATRRDIEKSLDFFSYICYLQESKLITPSEFGFFKRQLEKILADRSVQEYLEQSIQSEDGRFRYLVKYMSPVHCASNAADEPILRTDLENHNQKEKKDKMNDKKPLEEADFTEPTLLVRLKNAGGRKPEDAAKGWWKVKRESINGMKYAVVAIDGIVCGVYVIAGWQKYGESEAVVTDASHGFGGIPGRFQFSIAPAPVELEKRYMGRPTKNLFGKGAVNPIRYLGVQK